MSGTPRISFPTLIMPDTINPFATGNGPRYLPIFQKGRLNPNIPEQLAIIKQFLRSFEGTEQYDHYVEVYDRICKVQLKKKEEREETEPKAVKRGGEEPTEEAMKRTSDPETRRVKPKTEEEAKKEIEKAKEKAKKKTKKRGRPKKS